MSRRIPITINENISFDDVENGVRYFIKPRSGRTDLKYGALIENINTKDVIEKIDVICDLVDTFLCDVQLIKSKDEMPKLPFGVKYSDVLDQDSILFVYKKIMEANGITLEEKKSSSQPQTSCSEQSTTEPSTTVTNANVETESETAAQ